MTDTDPLMVDCGPHGKRIAAVVCKHLLRSEPGNAGFIENSSDPNDLQAWCHLCEEKFEQQGDMTAAFREFTGMTIVCVVCYGEAKSRNCVPAT